MSSSQTVNSETLKKFYLSVPSIKGQIYNLTQQCRVFQDLFSKVQTNLNDDISDVNIATLMDIMNNINTDLDKLRGLENENVILNKFMAIERQCPVCLQMMSTSEMVFGQCSHFCCRNCADKLPRTRCPICNGKYRHCIQYTKMGEKLCFKTVFITPTSTLDNNKIRPSFHYNTNITVNLTLQKPDNTSTDDENNTSHTTTTTNNDDEVEEYEPVSDRGDQDSTSTQSHDNESMENFVQQLETKYTRKRISPMYMLSRLFADIDDNMPHCSTSSVAKRMRGQEGTEGAPKQ